MKKHEWIFESYKRNHQVESFEDAERAKISKEKTQSAKMEKRAGNLVSKAIASTDDNLLDEIDTLTHESKKIAGNKKTHKSRLTELQKNDDFI